MPHEIDLPRAMREEIRWRILRVLDLGRPMPTSEILILRVLCDSALQATAHSLRRELDYLAERDLIKIVGRDGPVWAAKLTRYGVDVVDYTLPCEPGISRPPQDFD